jgi:hypothetical protein
MACDLYLTEGFSHVSMAAPIASGWSKIAGWDLHPLRNAALTRRTPQCDIPRVSVKVRNAAIPVVHILQAYCDNCYCSRWLTNENTAPKGSIYRSLIYSG